MRAGVSLITHSREGECLFERSYFLELIEIIVFCLIIVRVDGEENL